MRTNKELDALRANPQPMRTAQAALERARDGWLGDLANGEAKAELALYCAGTALGELPGLNALVTSKPAASAATASLMRAILPALASNPLGLVPFRHQVTRHHCVIELARAGSAAITLMVYWKHGLVSAETAQFSSGERHELCLQGVGSAVVVTMMGGGLHRARLERRIIEIRRGWCASFDNAHQTKLVQAVQQPLVLLRLARDARTTLPAQEFRLDDGVLVHQAAAHRIDSRREMALAVLGSMGRRDALPAIMAAARVGPDHVRWEALRQALAMDSAAGFALLGAIASDHDDSLHAAAASLRNRLLQAHPAFHRLSEAALCPA